MCQIMMKNKPLELFLDLLQSEKKDEEIKKNIIKIIANITCLKEMKYILNQRAS